MSFRFLYAIPEDTPIIDTTIIPTPIVETLFVNDSPPKGGSGPID